MGARRVLGGVVLAAGLALSCSASPNLHLEGVILLAGSHDKLWCSVELRDEKNPRRTAGALAIGIVLWSAYHLYRGRPRWYIWKIVKGGLVGAVAGLAIALLTIASAQIGLPNTGLVVINLVLSGFGWTERAPAQRYAPHRLESSAPV